MIFQDFSPKQRQAMLWWAMPESKQYDAIVCDGSVRSGKTMAMSIGFLIWSMRNFDRESFAFCGKTIDSLKRNVIQPLQKWMEGIVQPKINLSKNYMDVQWLGHENRYYFFGGKDESSYTLIQGITLSGVLFDEVALMPKSFVDQAVARTLSEPEARYWFNCNPESAEHWFYKEWICNTHQKKALHLHFTMQDNPILSPEQIADAERLYTGVFYNRYIKGLWCVAEGLIYPMFDKAVHVKSLPHPQGEWYVSVDYGTLNAFSAGLWCYDGTTAYRVAEYYYSGREQKRQRTNTQYLQSIQQLTAGKSISAVIVDPSAASFIAELRQAGFLVRKGKNDVVEGIRRTAAALEQGKLLFSPDCKNSFREFALYRWDESSSQDRPIKENDHAMDDIRYFVSTILREQPKPTRIGKF